MIENNAKNVSIKMGIVILLALISGLTLFKLSDKAAEKKNNDLQLKQSGKTN